MKYKPRNQYESRLFDGLVLLVVIGVVGLIGLAVVPVTHQFLTPAILGAFLILLGWCLANAVAHSDWLKERPEGGQK